MSSSFPSPVSPRFHFLSLVLTVLNTRDWPLSWTHYQGPSLALDSLWWPNNGPLCGEITSDFFIQSWVDPGLFPPGDGVSQTTRKAHAHIFAWLGFLSIWHIPGSKTAGSRMTESYSNPIWCPLRNLKKVSQSFCYFTLPLTINRDHNFPGARDSIFSLASNQTPFNSWHCRWFL